MDKAYDPKASEQPMYKLWEEGGYFTPKIDPNKTPFTIILPPPNANADLHVGHALYVVEDILVRYHRMKGDPTLWLPGADHAGFETQFVYEKHLAKEGKSRFDFDRDTLYKNIWDFVHTNRATMENQLRRLGFSLDWTRNTFTLDPKIVETVYGTFKKLYDDGLVYRGVRLVNYCTKCGTGFSDLEVKYEDRIDPMYYLSYGPFTIATVRPETKFRDTALAVNPKDKRYKKYIGQTMEIMGLLGPISMTVIPDPEVDPEFGTGIMKVTPAHDAHDFELGKKFNLPVTPIIDFKGRMDFSWFLSKPDIDPKYKARAENYHGKKVAEARALIVEDLKQDGLLVKVDEAYSHRVGMCYKSNTVIEPLPMEQWFVKVKALTDVAKKAVKEKKIQFVPKRFEKLALQWFTNFHDWNISRQIVWGIRIPAWKCLDCDKQLVSNPQSPVSSPMSPVSSWIITDGTVPSSCPQCHGANLVQDTDTFDTWFSSGQWPFATLQAQSEISKSQISNSKQIQNPKSKILDPYTGSDFSYFYPTSVMETGYDILPWWVCRMTMLGLYMTGNVPFKTVYLHGLVRDAKGQKMSKSKGNVINPLKMIDLYGTDALRFALIFGTAAGNDQALSEDKIRGMRNFANKLWNMGRFLNMNIEEYNKISDHPLPWYDTEMHKNLKNPHDKRIITELNMMTAMVTKNIENFRLSDAAKKIYDFTWHRVADVHLEKNKDRLKSGDEQALIILRHVYMQLLKLLHPFMPFVTESIYQQILGWNKTPLIVTPWPGMQQEIEAS